MALAPINLNCPHCGVLTHVCKDCVINCNACRNVWSVRVEKESPGFQELRVEWFNGLDVCGKPVYHHITSPAPEPAPKPKPQPREYKCLECGWHECSKTDWFKCTQCGNWTHDDIRARFAALKDLPLPDQVRNRLRGECAKHGVDYDAESARINSEPPRPFVRPVESPSLHAQRVGRIKRPGYDRKAARKDRENRRSLAWSIGASALLFVVGLSVTAHDFADLLRGLGWLLCGASWMWGYQKLDER